MLLLLLKRAPLARESGPRERQHLLVVGREDSEWGRMTTKGVLPEDIEVVVPPAADRRCRLRRGPSFPELTAN